MAAAGSLVPEVMKAKASSRPSASTTVPARVLTPVRVPVLAWTSRRAGGSPGPRGVRAMANRSLRVPVKPATGRPVRTGRSSGWPGCGGGQQQPGQQGGGEPVGVVEAAAVV